MVRRFHSYEKEIILCAGGRLDDFFFAACDSNTYADYASMEKSQLQGSLLMPISLEQLEQHSDCIVQGVLQNDAETCVTADPRFEWAMPSSGATKSTLTVTTILKGDGLLSIGDAISLYEPYYVYEVEGEPRLLYYSYYCPSEPGKTYLFFLNQNDAGGYAPSGFENSRFPLPDAQARGAASIDALTAEDLYLAEGVDLESYKALYREVLEAYAE